MKIESLKKECSGFEFQENNKKAKALTIIYYCVL